MTKIKITAALLFSLVLILVFPHFTQAQSSTPQETLQQYISDLQNNPNDNALREKIIKMVATMKPRPDIPKEAQRPFYKAVTFLKEAKDKSGYQLAIDSFREALSIAPWWPDAYYNLSKAQETAAQYDAAVQSMKLYLLTQPKAEDADEAEKALYALEAKQELEARAAREHEKKAEDISGMWRYAGGGPECWLFRINVTGSRLTITAFCGFESFPWATATVDGRNFEGSAIESMHGMAVRLKGKLNHDNNTITLEYETFDGSVRGTWKWERAE